MKKNVQKEVKEEAEEKVTPVSEIKTERTERDELVSVYEEMKRLGVNSIGDLEVRISRLQ